MIFAETEIPYIISENNNLIRLIQSKLDKYTTVIIGAVRKQDNGYYNTMYQINSESINFF